MEDNATNIKKSNTASIAWPEILEGFDYKIFNLNKTTYIKGRVNIN